MNAATIFKTLTTVTLSITLLITGGCNNMEAKKEETGKNTAIENIFARKSVRTYTPQPIEKEKVDLLVKMTAQAPLAIVVCGDLSKALNGETDRYWMLDCSAASENLLLAAESMGLGAVWTAVYPESDRIAKVRSVLSLPDHIIPFNLIPVGYPQHREEAKDKFKTENIHYNKW